MTNKTGPKNRPDPYALDRVPKPEAVAKAIERTLMKRLAKLEGGAA